LNKLIGSYPLILSLNRPEQLKVTTLRGLSIIPSPVAGFLPFLSMIIFSKTCGSGLNGAKIIKTAITIRIEYGILSMIDYMIFLRNFKKQKMLPIFQINEYLSRK